MIGRFSAVAILTSGLALAGCDSGTATTSLRSPAETQPSFIVHGSLDGNLHPAVVLVEIDSAGSPMYRCSGTFIAPKIVLTAGHCVGEPGEFSGFRVFTESDVQDGNNNYPYPGPNTIEAKAWHSHPLFTEAQFYLHDVAVIELQAPFNLPASAYGKLPAVNSLDVLKTGKSTTFTSVGYGVQEITSSKEVAEKIRMYAQPYLKAINTTPTGTFSIELSNNASTGGTCYGDSGGPNYLGTSNVIAGLTSFGRAANCGGTGGVFRLDRKDVIDFVSQYLK